MFKFEEYIITEQCIISKRGVRSDWVIYTACKSYIFILIWNESRC